MDSERNKIKPMLIRKYIYTFIILCLFSGIIFSCAGDTVYFTIEDLPEKEDAPIDSSLNGTLSFTVSCGGSASNGISYGTKAFFQGLDTIPLPLGRIVTLYIYNGNKTPQTGSPVYYGKYTVQKPGILTPMYADPSLPAGEYNLYAVSELNNASDKTPNFGYNSGLASGLYNGLDYLWWCQKSVRVESTTAQTIPILFAHASTQILVNFKMTGCQIDTIYQATLNYPSTYGCTYQLGTGIIKSSTNMSMGYFNLNITQNMGFINYVPFEGDIFDAVSGIDGMVYLKACGANQGWQTFTLPLPSNYELVGGYMYEYTVYVTQYASAVARAELMGVKRISDLPGQK